MWWTWIATSHAAAWVLESERPRALQRALKAAGRAEVTRVVGYGAGRLCVEVEEPRLGVRNRVARRLGRAVETRSDCDWAWYPEGRGWTALLVDPPAPGLEGVVQSLDLPYYVLQISSDGPIRLCASTLVAGNGESLVATLKASAYQVRGPRSVGACRRP